MHPSIAPLARSRARRPRPLLKWAGGKRQLLPQIRRFYPADFNAYLEPFAGSAAVFFDLHTSGLLDSRPVTLIDSNHDLIGCYEMVRDRTGDVIAALRELEMQYRTGGEQFFYKVRDEQFNPLRAGSRSVHAGARRDADFSEPDRLQRIVPAQLQGRVQRAPRPLRQSVDLR